MRSHFNFPGVFRKSWRRSLPKTIQRNKRLRRFRGRCLLHLLHEPGMDMGKSHASHTSCVQVCMVDIHAQLRQCVLRHPTNHWYWLQMRSQDSTSSHGSHAPSDSVYIYSMHPLKARKENSCLPVIVVSGIHWGRLGVQVQ